MNICVHRYLTGQFLSFKADALIRSPCGLLRQADMGSPRIFDLPPRDTQMGGVIRFCCTFDETFFCACSNMYLRRHEMNAVAFACVT